jgi:hypothetical protein
LREDSSARAKTENLTASQESLIDFSQEYLTDSFLSQKISLNLAEADLLRKKAVTICCAIALLISMLFLPLVEFASANFYHVGPPTVTVLSPLTDQIYGQSSNIPINVQVEMYSNAFPSWERLAWIKYSLDNQPEVTLTIQNSIINEHYEGTGTGTLSGLSNGPHSLYIHGQTELTKDSKPLNIFNATIFFVVDSVNPTIQVLSPQQKTYSSTAVSLEFKSDRPLSWTGYSLDQNLVVASYSSGSTLINLHNGYHSLRIYAQDSAGKVYASQAVVFKINGKNPPIVAIDIDAIINARPYLPSDFQDMTYWKLIFHVSEPSSWMGYTMDGGANQTVEGNTILRMSYGTHTVVVYAKDVCGNSGASASYTFVLGPGEAGSAYASPSASRKPLPTNGTLNSDPTPTATAAIPEFPSLTVAVLLFIATLSITIILKPKKEKQ